ncbi:glycosyltransferase family 2 protein [Flavobacterium dankookense]|uniref:Cellulose synthase/poly-beta-1,6-N-acetylglucosamine synthase-like glycosyltransferase n=1 Tax=Flavobacterium dankookense TaxID=706186 RepID=A0A4R6Q839_9FLAO|nr:glycosyltransferase [Flavobacterium dankookense]TDP58714.1 cellulose synthase/poly-beta-1,6-N-acetylglucosamine synthase-like glycosyltransferase [Flavobacterium dankookense]
MELIYIISLIVLLIYIYSIARLFFGFSNVKVYENKNLVPKTRFSLIVPFRNEEKNLSKLLESFSELNYPHDLIEIIMIDDFSKDQSERVYIQWRMKNDTFDTTLLENLRLSNSPKKDAIARAIPIVKNEWIITTDADCVVNKNWLLTIDNYIQENNVEMIASSVIYKTKNNWFHHFQQMDLLSLQGTTIGSFGLGKPFMCNGANFTYKKQLFIDLDGFNGNNKIASGDDVFLLQKATQKSPEKVHFLKSKDTIVVTKPENDLFKLFMQRVRWASKTSSYSSLYAKFLAITVMLMNLSLILSLWFVLIQKMDWKILLGTFLIKYFIDYILLFKTNKFLLNGRFILPLASSLIYPFFASTVAIYSLFGNYSWKGRRFKK